MDKLLKKINTVSIFFLILVTSGSNIFSTENIFKDPVIRKIYQAAYDRNSLKLISFLKNRNPKYRRYAALCMGSVQDRGSVDDLTPLLTDRDENVRSAAAFAIGQSGNEKAEPKLIEMIKSEKNGKALKYMYEALGKTGSSTGLEFLVRSSKKAISDSSDIGISVGFFRFMLRKIYSKDSITAVIERLENSGSSASKYFSSLLLARIKKFDLAEWKCVLIKKLKSERDLFVRLNLITALGKIKSPDVKKVLLDILVSEGDYREKVNALRALKTFDIEDSRSLIFKLCRSGNHHVSYSAASLIFDSIKNIDPQKLIDLGKKVIDSRTASMLVKSALKVSGDKTGVSSLIKKRFSDSTDPIEMGFLLDSLGEYPGNFSFLVSTLFKTENTFIRTSSAGAVSSMFSGIKNERELKKKGLPSVRYVLKFIRRSIASGDLALVSIATYMLRDIKFLKKEISDTGFLYDAIKACKLPGDIETYLDLKKTIEYITGNKYSSLKKNEKTREPRQLNWELIEKLPAKCTVKISTSSGNICLNLYVNDAPGSVSNFIQLAGENFFSGTYFHRVVPNFVIQGGCNRGDGWGGPGYVIRSEFFPVYYREGSIGMASAGKDTEGSQWFITHSPTSHLDGRYTLFGNVVSGMDIVHNIKIGDRILSVKIINDPETEI